MSKSIYELERIRRKKYQLYRLDPFEWCKDVLGEELTTFKWSAHGGDYATHTWDGSPDPMWNAWRSLIKHKWVGVESATGVGKTFWVARAILWFLDCYEDSLVITTAPVERQLKQNLWGEISVLLEKYKKVRPQMRSKTLSIKPEGDNDFCPYGDRWEAIGITSGVGAEEESATKYQGYHRENMLIVCEEAAALHPSIMNAIKNTCSGLSDGDNPEEYGTSKGNNLIIAIGNPDSELDELHKFCTLGERVDSYRISAFDHPNVVLNDTIVKGAVTTGSIKLRAADYGEDSKLYLSRVRGITPTDSHDSLIRMEWLKRSNPNLSEFANEYVMGHAAMGIDVANSENGDKGCVATGQGNKLIHVVEFTCPNASHIADNVLFDDARLHAEGRHIYNTPKAIDLQVMPSYIGVDAVGVGVSTINRFLEHGYMVQSIHGGQFKEAIPHDAEGRPLYAFNGLRSQLFWELREDLRRGTVILDVAEAKLWRAVVKELNAIKFSLTGGAIAIESKDKLKKRLGKSPNLADAIAYWNWVRKGYKVTEVITTIG